MFFCEIFDIWDIAFLGPFPSSFGFFYILHAIYYVSKRVKATATRINDSRVVADFIKSNIFVHFEMPRVMVSDRKTYFVIRWWKYYFESIALSIKFSCLITVKQIVKPRYQIEKSSPYWRKWFVPIEKTRVWDWKTHCQPTEQHIKHQLVCLHIGWCLGSHAIF